MRGLYDIPTRLRRSRWYLAEGVYRASEKKPSADTPSPFGGALSLDFLPDGTSDWIPLLVSSTNSLAWQISQSLGVQLLPRNEVRPCRVLLRWVERANDSGSWDLALSPGDATTISLVQVIEQTSGKARVSEVVELVRPFVRAIQWPAWVPNDESLPLQGEEQPPDLDLRLWELVREAIRDTFQLEDDQVFWNLEMDRLGPDSLDWVWLVMQLEAGLDIEIDDAVALELASQATVGEVYRLVEQALDRR